MLKISIITVCYNSEKYIRSAIESVKSQTYSNIEYIVIDGGSSDDTIDIVKEYKSSVSLYISEPDNGIYDAMNKGVALATGDVVGVLNSDDFFSSKDIISKIVNTFSNSNIDALYGDIGFVNPYNENVIVRYYSSKYFRRWMFHLATSPPHPSFYVKKTKYVELGNYDSNYKIGADLDLMMRFMYKSNINYTYLEESIVTMRLGGVSTDLSNIILLNRECLLACKNNAIYSNWTFMLVKYLLKFINQKLLYFLKR